MTTAQRRPRLCAEGVEGFAVRRLLEDVKKSRSGESLAFPRGDPQGCTAMCMGVVTSVGCDRPSRSMPGIAGCSCDPGAPADPSPFHQASSGASIRSHTGLRLQLGAVRAAPHGRSTKARDGSALQTTQRSSAARLKSAYGRRGSVEDGSMRRSGFALVARAALYGSSGAGAGHDCERLLRARRPRCSDRLACVRRMLWQAHMPRN